MAVLRHWSIGVSRFVVAMLVVVVAMPATVDAVSSRPAPIMSVRSHPHGRSYGAWSAAWWQWAYSLPVDAHPLYDNADCSTGQSGRVWFLGGAFQFDAAPNGDVVAIRQRSCTVPRGTFLFVPVINSEASTLEGNGSTEAELRAAAKSFQDAAQSMTISVDGVPVTNLAAFRVQSPLFTFGPLPENNILQSFGFDAPQGSTSLSAGDGVYVMVRPLHSGSHTIHLHGEVPSFRLFLDITYEITVTRQH